MVNGGAVNHPKIAAVALLNLELNSPGPNLVGHGWYAVNYARVSFYSIAWRPSFFTPFKFYHQPEIVIGLVGHDVTKPPPAHVDHAIFKSEYVQTVVVFSILVQKNVPVSRAGGIKKFFSLLGVNRLKANQTNRSEANEQQYFSHIKKISRKAAKVKCFLFLIPSPHNPPHEPSWPYKSGMDSGSPTTP